MAFRVLLVVALLGMGVAAADAAKNEAPQKVSSFFGALKFEQSRGVSEEASFSGRVAPRPCRQRRVVYVSTAKNNAVGFDFSDRRGRFAVSSTFNPVSPGMYKIRTDEKVIRREGIRIICKATEGTIRVTANGSRQPRVEG